MTEVAEEISIEDALRDAIAEQEEPLEEASTLEAVAEPEPEPEPELEPEPQPEPSPEPVAASQPPVGAPLEGWDAVPENYKDYMRERERHMDQTMEQVAVERRQAQRVNEFAQKFGAVMAAEGVNDPIDAMHGMAESVAVLRMGSPQQKAQVAATLINNYGIDIQLLADTIEGEVPQQQSQPRAIADPRLDYVFNRLQQAEQHAEQKTRADTDAAIKRFMSNPENKYADRVTATMVDFVGHMNRNNATGMSFDDILQAAYQRACAMDPEISQIIARERLTDTQPAVAAKKAAAASLTGKQSGDGLINRDNMSIEDTIRHHLDTM